MEKVNLKLPDRDSNVVNIREPQLKPLEMFEVKRFEYDVKMPSKAQMWKRINQLEDYIRQVQQQNIDGQSNQETTLYFTRSFAAEQNRQWKLIHNMFADVESVLTTIKRHISIDVCQRRITSVVQIVSGLREKLSKLGIEFNMNEVDWEKTFELFKLNGKSYQSK